MEEERAQRDNRFIERDSRRFSDGRPQANVGRSAYEKARRDSDSGDIRASVGADFAAEFLSDLAFEDDLFRYPVSSRGTLQGVFSDVARDMEYLGEDTHPDERAESGADRRFMFQTSGGKIFYVFERENEVFIDVSRLDEGDRGSAIYAAIGNYAFNTDKVFIGDPNGISESAVIRRVSAMLSSALRFGTTRHIAPHPDQVRGYPHAGIPPLEWKGTDAQKVASLIDNFLATMQDRFPGLNDYEYDFRGHRIVDRRGRPIDAERLEYGKTSGDARRARAGEATLRRAVFLKSLVSSPGGARPGLLEDVLTRSGQYLNADLRSLFSVGAGYKTRETPVSIRAHLTSHFGEAGVASLESANVLRIIPSWDALPGHIRKNGEPGARAFYDGRDKVAYLIADRLTAGTAPSVLLHEVGEHYGLRRMLGETGYRAIGARIRVMARNPDSLTRLMWDQVKRGYNEFRGLDDAELGNNERFLSEVIARLGEEAAFASSGVWQQIKTLIQRFLLSIGLSSTLNEYDVMALVAGSLKHAMRTAGWSWSCPHPVDGLWLENQAV